ncbi:MAG: hypothetical protein LBM19_03725, partial [Holosporales bacterium]|nr:hypothetical protein [Holosporales bacterium]
MKIIARLGIAGALALVTAGMVMTATASEESAGGGDAFAPASAAAMSIGGGSMGMPLSVTALTTSPDVRRIRDAETERIRREALETAERLVEITREMEERTR